MEEIEYIDEEMPLVNDDELFNDSIEISIQRPNLNQMKPPELMEVKHENNRGAFTTGIDIFSKEEQMKMEERAKRFGLANKSDSLMHQEQDLYASMGITEDDDTKKCVRLNVLHMNGTENMSTVDVYKYFEHYAPTSIEWINGFSCNIVWLDPISAARALLGLSRKIRGLEASNDSIVNEYENENKQLDDDILIQNVHCPIPPGIWRKGADHPKSKNIFIRFATRFDKKQPKVEISNRYRREDGISLDPVKGILTGSRKRTFKQRRLNENLITYNGDNSNKAISKNPWGDLSENWGINDFVEDYYLLERPHNKEQKSSIKEQKSSIKERLGLKRVEPRVIKESDSDDCRSVSSEEDWCKKSKMLRMRMHADDEEEKLHKRRAKIQSQNLLNNLRGGGVDLRSRLGRPKPTTQIFDTIQVVVTNTQAPRSNLSNIVRESEEEDGEIIEDDENEEEEPITWIENNKVHDKLKKPSSQEDQEQAEEEGELDDEEDEDEDEIPVKEAQGPKGSVIKVVERKPRLASTVWTRLNHVKSEIKKPHSVERQVGTRDLRESLKGDLRSRIGNRSKDRSPLRIEVKNDKYTEEDSDTE